jgi:hypothetical protein
MLNSKVANTGTVLGVTVCAANVAFFQSQNVRKRDMYSFESPHIKCASNVAKIMCSKSPHLCIEYGENNMQDPEFASAQKLGLKLGFL